MDSAAAPAGPDSVETLAQRASETILLVQDDAADRALTRTILEQHGYLVIEAQCCGDALLICEEHTATIHVLLTDVIMARMSGWKLAERLGFLRPDMKALFMSGHTDDSFVRHGVLVSSVGFIKKPITPETLIQKLRDVIESQATGQRARSSAAALAPARASEGID